MEIYFGDIHNHCNISYGFGSLANALKEARNQLDFCSVTGHGLWPDIFEKNEDTSFIVDFHNKGFKKLHENWQNTKNQISAANEEDKFVTFQSYEMHSLEFGDHHILSPDDNLELYKGSSPSQIISNLSQEAIAIPHHIAYTPGYRGINWDTYNSDISPIIEVYSKHGCSVSEESDGQYLHTMGPRDGRNTVYSGLLKGKRFGFTASTDHHAGYPGSYGDGITAVLSEALTREYMWEALKNGRTYALTGDRIRCRFTVDDHYMGSLIKESKSHNINLKVEAVDYVEKAVVYKNLEPVKIIYKEDLKSSTKQGKYKIRIESGWGRKATPFKWLNSILIKNGKLLSVDPCFRGQSVLAPIEGEEYSDNVNKLDNKIIQQDEERAVWQCTTFKNPSTRHSATGAIVIEVEGNLSTRLEIEFNEKRVSVGMHELLEHGISGHMKSYNSEAFLIHKAVHDTAYIFEMNCFTGSVSGDFFHAEVHQTNGQSAWISPIFII